MPSGTVVFAGLSGSEIQKKCSVARAMTRAEVKGRLLRLGSITLLSAELAETIDGQHRAASIQTRGEFVFSSIP